MSSQGVVYVAKEATMINVQCSSRNDKPGKNEKPVFFKVWMTYKSCPDCDKKRIEMCNDPNCVRRRSH